MFKRIELENFRSFGHVTLDLTGPRDSPLRLAAVYGENGCGKTDLIDSVVFLRDTVGTIAVSEDVRSLALRRRMLSCDDPMTVSYRMLIDGSDADYSMTFGTDGRVIREELRYRIRDRVGRYYLIESSEDGVSVNLGNSLFQDREYRAEMEGAIGRLWGDHTFLSIMNGEYLSKDRVWMDARIRPGMGDVLGYIRGIAINSPSLLDGTTPADRIGRSLECGVIPADEMSVLDAYGDAISRFLGRLYSDIRGVRYITEESSDGSLQYELVIMKRVAGEVRDIPVGLESRGTRNLISLLPALIACAGGGTAFIDGLDYGLHDKFVSDIMEQIVPDMGGQLVFTTHNTSLLESIDPRSAFVIRVDIEGFKDISSFPSIARTQRNNNNRQRYLYGQFDGVPIIGNVGIRDISERFHRNVGERFGPRRRRGGDFRPPPFREGRFVSLTLVQERQKNRRNHGGGRAMKCEDKDGVMAGSPPPGMRFRSGPRIPRRPWGTSP